VLKTTLASGQGLNTTPLVVNEITLIGSRCGRFQEGIRMIQSHGDMPLERLLTASYPMEQALEAFQEAAEPHALKVVLTI
jgi:threonine dehydrogenase-like Zn-dependent dehydrogenase